MSVSAARELRPVGAVVGGEVLLPDGLVSTDVVVEGHLIGAIGKGDAAADAVDASGCYVVPGFIDIHFHGCMGADLCDATAGALKTIAEHEASRGVTAICPATMTFPEDLLVRIAEIVHGFRPDAHEAALVGFNLEGPYISPEKVGAQNPAYVRPCSTREFTRIQGTSCGMVKLVDIAPEEPEAMSFIETMADRVRISLAHTCADYDTARLAFEKGARHLTHLFNAMPGLHHRNPGPIAAAAERDDVTAELIADGIHVHPAMVRLAFSLFGGDRIILISDSMRATGLEDGTYDLGGQDVTVRGPRATLENGALAGSVTDLAACVATAVTQMGIPFETAVRAATINPARAVGIDDVRGSIEVGKIADMVLLDKETLAVKQVIVRGRAL